MPWGRAEGKGADPRVGAADGMEIAVDDDGSGIARSAYVEAFKPFTRLDPACRNANGVGLSLAIARDIARARG